MSLTPPLAPVSRVPAVDLPLVIAEVEVTHVQRLSPSFVRLRLGGEAIADIGVDGQPMYDQRFKMLVPTDSGALIDVTTVGEDWYGAWRACPPERRGHMRTYTIRALEGEGRDRLMVVDIVIHPDGDESGPGARWAESASPGDRVGIVAPRRGHFFGGIEFAPTPGDDLLLVADETALPAVAAILEALPADARGQAYVEVPGAGDIVDLVAPEGVQVRWYPRDGASVGQHVHRAVAEHLRLESSWAQAVSGPIDPDLWDTPIHSTMGESDEGDVTPSGRYAWVAGEAGLVKAVRRLLKDQQWPRSQSAFMGYWRIGVAMKS